MSIAEKLKNIAENQYQVFCAGKQAEYDHFWDVYQQYGNRTDYREAFSVCWTDEAFYPKYNIAPVDAGSMFHFSKITDLKEKLDAMGVKLDTSDTTTFTQAFQGASITHIPELDMRNAKNTSYTFGSACRVVTIDKLIVSENTAFSANTFNTAYWLTNILIEGTIGVSVNLQWSPLTKASIESVIAALSDATSDCVVSFSKAAVNKAFETVEGLADGSTSAQWLDLTATKSNWKFILV